MLPVHPVPFIQRVPLVTTQRVLHLFQGGHHRSGRRIWQVRSLVRQGSPARLKRTMRYLPQQHFIISRGLQTRHRGGVGIQRRHGWSEIAPSYLSSSGCAPCTPITHPVAPKVANCTETFNLQVRNETRSCTQEAARKLGSIEGSSSIVRTLFAIFTYPRMGVLYYMYYKPACQCTRRSLSSEWAWKREAETRPGSLRSSTGADWTQRSSNLGPDQAYSRMSEDVLGIP